MRTLIALAAFTLWMAMGAGAQVYDLRLHHTDPEALSPEAKMHYDQAVAALDRIDYIAAVRQMGMAAELAPDSPEIQSHFITLALRTVRPDSYSIEDSLAIADQVLDSYDRILNKENLPQYIRDYFGRERGDFLVMLDGIGQRIEERRNLSQAYAQSYTAELQHVEEARERFFVNQAAMREAEETGGQAGYVTDRANDGEAIQGNPLLPLRNN